MNQDFWNEVQKLAQSNARLVTKTGAPFELIDATETRLLVRVSTGAEHSLNRANLEKAIRLLQSGVELSGPKDYHDQVADDRPAYAWALLYALGYIK